MHAGSAAIDRRASTCSARTWRRCRIPGPGRLRRAPRSARMAAGMRRMPAAPLHTEHRQRCEQSASRTHSAFFHAQPQCKSRFLQADVAVGGCMSFQFSWVAIDRCATCMKTSSCCGVTSTQRPCSVHQRDGKSHVQLKTPGKQWICGGCTSQLVLAHQLCISKETTRTLRQCLQPYPQGCHLGLRRRAPP
jgi:hypothetical protein